MSAFIRAGIRIMDKKQKAQLVAYYGAGTESRTRTGVNPPDPKSGRVCQFRHTCMNNVNTSYSWLAVVNLKIWRCDKPSQKCSERVNLL